MDLTRPRFRLLFLLPFPPRLRGLHGGARVTGQLIAGLARRHDLAALYLMEPGDPPVDQELVDVCARLEPVERRDVAGSLRFRAATKLAMLRGIPTWVSELSEPRFASRVQELAEEWRPDLVQLEYPVMGQYLPSLEGYPAPRVLVDHEASLRDLRRWRGRFGPIVGALDARAFRRFERGVIHRVQAAVVFTKRDRRALEGLGVGTPIVQIPLGTPLPASPLDPIGSSAPGVLFVGNFEHSPNVDAALWLATRIFPSLREEHPGARLTLVGPSAPPELRALAAQDITLTGGVSDVTPYLEDAAVVAVPIRTGGGMRVKVLEALAAGKAVVATPLAVEGLEVTGGDQLELAETEDELRRALSDLLSDEEARRELAGRARAWATEHLGWDASISRYEALYDSLVSGAPPVGRAAAFD